MTCHLPCRAVADRAEYSVAVCAVDVVPYGTCRGPCAAFVSRAHQTAVGGKDVECGVGGGEGGYVDGRGEGRRDGLPCGGLGIVGCLYGVGRALLREHVEATGVADGALGRRCRQGRRERTYCCLIPYHRVGDEPVDVDLHGVALGDGGAGRRYLDGHRIGEVDGVGGVGEVVVDGVSTVAAGHQQVDGRRTLESGYDGNQLVGAGAEGEGVGVEYATVDKVYGKEDRVQIGQDAVVLGEAES